MNPPESNDPIEKLLREQEAHVPDDGFTKRVIAQLPRRNDLMQRKILLSLAIIGAIAAVIWMPWKSLPEPDLGTLFSSNSNAFSAWLPFAVVLFALGSVAWNGLRKED